MRLRHLFAVNIIFALFFGLSCTLLPRSVFWLYGVQPQEPALWATKLLGGSILGFATLMWFGFNAASIDSRRAIASALIVQDLIGCIASLQFQLTYEVNIVGWFSLTLYGVLALWYASFLFLRPDAC